MFDGLNKTVRDGKVAVLISPDWGAGWYTWNLEHPDMIFDPAVVDFVENNKFDELEAYANLKWPNAYLGGMGTLKVVWVDQGTQFRINEHDGSESLEIQGSGHWIVA